MSSATILGLASPALAERVRLLTSQALRTWSLRWGVEADVACAPAEGAGTGAGNDVDVLCEQGAAAGARLFWPRGLDAALQSALYGGPPAPNARDNLAARSTRHLAQDLRKLLSQAWQVADWTPDAAAAPSRWAAPVAVDVTVAGAHVRALVPAVRLRPSRGREPQAMLSGAALAAAFAPLRVPVTACIGRARMSLADIAGVQCGDVLLLDAALREPVRLDVEGGPASLRAILGRAGAHRAVQLIQPEPRGLTVPNDQTSRSIATTQDVELSPLDAAASGPALLPARLAAFAGVKASVEVVAGRASASVGELLALKEGSVLVLDRAVDAAFDVVLDGAVLARGQLVAVGEQFGVRITEVCMPATPEAAR